MSAVNTSLNTSSSVDRLRPSNSRILKNKTSDKLYKALMDTKDTESKKTVRKLLVADKKEWLSENDREKIWYTLDYLRISWNSKDLFSNFKKEDFEEIKNLKTSSNRAEKLVQILIEKGSDRIDDIKEKKEFKNDITAHVDAMMKWRNAEIGNNIAEDISLTPWTTRRVRYYWDKIRKIIKEHGGNISECYEEVMKNANYAALPMRKKALTRYPVPVKFWWRDMHRQTENTLNLLEKKSGESDDNKEKLAINYVIKRLQEAYNCYKESIWVSNSRFDEVQHSNEDRIYRNAA